MKPINAYSVRYGTVKSQTVLHATGGIRVNDKPAGFFIGPFISNSGGLIEVGPVPASVLKQACLDLHVKIFGAEEIYHDDPLLPSRDWRPLTEPVPHHPYADDIWGQIAGSAWDRGDEEYAACARAVSTCLRAAGIRLRDASDEYNKQLIAESRRNTGFGNRFQNAALADLHLAFHSLLSEMGSTRDHLASIARMESSAPSWVDSAANLTKWVKNKNVDLTTAHAAIKLIAEASDKAGDPWLLELGTYRNRFLHRQPMSLNENSKWLKIEERSSPLARVLLVQLQVEITPKPGKTMEALELFVELYAKLNLLAKKLAEHARYKPDVQVFRTLTVHKQ